MHTLNILFPLVFIFIFQFSKGPATDEPQQLKFRAYVTTPKGEAFTNVRETPNGKIIAKLTAEDYFIVFIVDHSNGWMKVDSIHGFETEIALKGKPGWIHCSQLGVGTRNYGDQPLKIYTTPSSNAKVAGLIERETGVTFSAFSGDFAYIEYFNGSKTIFGWIEKSWLCGNPVTNCC